MEESFSRFELTSRRLLSFLVTVFTRLDLGENNFTWNLVRYLVRDGFYVISTCGLREFRVVCFSCGATAYHSLKEFVHAVFNAYHDRAASAADRRLGYIPIDSDVCRRLSHHDNCARWETSVDDLDSYLNCMLMRKICAVAYENNRSAVKSTGEYVCRVCLQNATDIVCLPCGHVYSCFSCLIGYLRAEGTFTPIGCFVCRTPITAVQQLYFA